MSSVRKVRSVSSSTRPSPGAALSKSVPRNEAAESDDWVKQQKGESMSAAMTRTIRENINDTARSSFIVGKVLRRASAMKVYVDDGFETMDAFITARCPEISVAWAYVLMSVADEFTLENVETFGIAPLSEIIKLHGLAPEFEHYPPKDMIIGAYEFADAHGKPVTLNFPAEHSVDHLKKLVAIARDAARARKGAPAPKSKLSEVGKQIAAKVKAAASAVPTAKWNVREARNQLSVELRSESARMSDLLKKIAKAL